MISDLLRAAPVPGTSLAKRSQIVSGQPASGPEPVPSVIITLGGMTKPGPAATYTKPPMPVWEMVSDDAMTLRMSRQYASETGTARFSGLGASLMNQFASNGADFSQSVSLTPGSGLPDSAFSLKVVTASGKAVSFALSGNKGELAVRIESSGGMDSIERAAVAALAGGFQKAMDGLTGAGRTLDLAALAAFDTATLASVDFSATSAADGASPMTVALRADATSRAVKIGVGGGSIDVAVDAPGKEMVGTAAQRARMMVAYLSQVDRAVARGHGDHALAAMFKDVFTELHAVDDVASGLTRPSTLLAPSAEDMLLSGLADYRASFAQGGAPGNPMRPGEADGFSFQTFQKTRIGAPDTKNREISQLRSSHLVASFHSPLSGHTPGLGPGPGAQNYLYTQIDDTTTSQADVAYRNGLLVKASITRTVSETTRQTKVVMGRVVDDTTTPVSESTVQDLLVLLATTQQRGRGPSSRTD